MYYLHKKSIFINCSFFDKSTKIKVLILTRSFTKTICSLHKPEYLALEHIKSGKLTKSWVINKILLNQNIIVNDSKLKELLNVKGV